MPKGQIQARAKFRDFDGRIRLVAKHGRTRAAAERALKIELTNRQTPGGSSAIAVAANPVRDSSARISVGKKSPRALTPEETTTLVGWLRANQRAVALDIPDLVDWMLATGCRIGEALALRHTLATQAINRGMCLEAIAALLGHRSMEMTLVYARIANRVVADEHQAVSAKIDTLYGPQIGQDRIEVIRLRHIARRPIQQETRRRIRLTQPVTHHRHRHLVRQQITGIQVLLGQLSPLRTSDTHSSGRCHPWRFSE